MKQVWTWASSLPPFLLLKNGMARHGMKETATVRISVDVVINLQEYRETCGFVFGVVLDPLQDSRIQRPYLAQREADICGKETERSRSLSLAVFLLICYSRSTTGS